VISITQKLFQAASCLLSIAVVNSDYRGTEFGGGTLTGPLTDFNKGGGLLFITALLLTFVYPWLAAMIALAASLFMSALHLYLTMTGVAQRIIPGNYSAPAKSLFYWDQWALLGIFMLVANAYLCCREWHNQR